LKNVISYLCVALLVLIMQGCSFNTAPQKPEISTQNVSNQQPNTQNANPKLSHLVGKNYIKGVVTNLKYDTDAQVWNYVIDGVDTSNGKLPYVNFNHKAVLANEGDLVYASFNGMRLDELLVIKAGYFKNGKIAPTSPIKHTTYKKKSTVKSTTAEPDEPGVRNKAHQVISVPQEETIRLN